MCPSIRLMKEFIISLPGEGPPPDRPGVHRIAPLAVVARFARIRPFGGTAHVGQRLEIQGAEIHVVVGDQCRAKPPPASTAGREDKKT